MATNYLDYSGLSRYDSKIKTYIGNINTTLQGNIDSEAGTRASEDTAIKGRLSDLENAGYITNTVDNLTNYYLKTQTYTKTEVDNIIGGLATIQIAVVDELPVVGQSNYIYLVPKDKDAEILDKEGRNLIRFDLMW